MKHIFKRVVVLLNKLDDMDRVLKKAIKFSDAHNSALEILFVHEEPLFEMPDFFLSDKQIEDEKIDKNKITKKIEEHLEKFDITQKIPILVFIDDTVDRTIVYGREDKEILFITNYYEGLSSNLIEKTPYSYWIIKNEYNDYNNIALPLDFTSNSAEVIEASKHIFPISKIIMIHDYRYIIDTLIVQEDYMAVAPIDTSMDLELNEELKQQQKENFEEYKQRFNIDGVFMEEESTLEDDLVNYIQSNNFDLTVLYHHKSNLFLSPNIIVKLVDSLSLDFFVFTI
jgi:hypothetical protein